ncbi:VPLPA-CTERM sorting domain-containing protein [uncultured Roseobacter sp.]|uniref:VPLPA-CTERM sorting domain-containing protein n=1 Tax=uncultured Roseobacter sp. TaxID=114847 RepID=UPI0026390ABC|nr:VPLPA-CTERM sorting domain-containing protein [uncultured Roseobacter sp.]
MIFRHLAVGATALTLMAGSATAATFEGSTAGLFLGFNFFDGDSASRPTASDCTTAGCKSVSWGNLEEPDAPTTLTRTRPASSDRSVMTFRDTDFSADLEGDKVKVDVAYIDWYNAEWSNFDDLFELNAEFEFGMTSPASLTSFDLFTLVIGTTGNDSASNDDTATLAGFEDFRLGTPLNLTRGYVLSGFSFSVLGDGGVDGDVWSTQENRSSTLVISAHIEAVPLPAAGWLLIAGVGGLAAMKRRRKNAS